MRIDIITIFPEMFDTVLNESIIKRAQARDKVKIRIHNLRDYTKDKHKKVDDRPFGGGSGMVMSPEPIFEAVEDIKSQVVPRLRPSASSGRTLSGVEWVRLGQAGRPSAASFGKLGANPERSRMGSLGTGRPQVVLLCPQGKRLTQEIAKIFSKYKQLILICGHYEGIDERVRKYLIDEEISIGDYVLTGGELPAMVLIDAVVRLLPGVLGDKNSLKFESFEGNLLEYPHYTRPADYKGKKVPDVLLSGDHKRIELWRKEQAIKRTKQRRPDLLK
jgi:tRNA (guanine37-N1)-methyltransferase